LPNAVAPSHIPEEDDDDDDDRDATFGGTDIEGHDDHDNDRDRDEHRDEGKSLCPDAVIDRSHGLELRAERSNKGNGRVYTVWFTATDGRGESCDGSVQVCVPRKNHHGDCTDDGQKYDSFGPCPARGHDHHGEAIADMTVSAPTPSASTLEYYLPEAGQVTVAVYDVAGRRS